VCAGPLERSGAILFCGSCRASLQPFAELAGVLAIPGGGTAQAFDLDRHADPLGACPSCSGGSLRPGRMLGETAAACSGCDARWVAAGALGRMKSRGRAPGAGMVAGATGGSAYAERFEHARRFAFDTPLANTYALPAALAAGAIGHFLGLGILVWATVEMWFHELGHAVVAWLGGFMAVPLPFFTVVPREERSPLVVIVVAGLIGAVAWEAWRRKYRPLLAGCGVLLLVQIALTFGLNPAQAAQWWIFAGQAGAIVLPAVVMVAFYQRAGWRWDFWRYPALVIAAIGYAHAMFTWIGVARGTEVMPHGSAVGQESEGDMERLVRTYAWTRESLAHAYLVLGLACLGVLAIVYLAGLRRAKVVSS
jgi:hypothetical protein